MKTIEEAAKEYRNTLSSYDYENDIIETGFIKGVKFAQQWTSVDEELPQDSGNVLIMNADDRKGFGYYMPAFNKWVVAKLSETAKDFGEVKFWRPIELK